MGTATDRAGLIDEIASLTSRLDTVQRQLDALDGVTNADGIPTLVELEDEEDNDVTRRFDPTKSYDGVTAAKIPADAREGSLVAPPTPTMKQADFDARYVRGELLGEGGMGEVRLYTDKTIGRAVAMKVLRPEAAAYPKLRERFFFEAHVQGQLEHPSIVPVHDLGVRPDGAEYFTMKRVIGRTLQQILTDLRRSDVVASVTFTRWKLLTAFKTVCLATEFAHKRGIVHRDLKPANIMLGAFGEVSVLDWGIAKRIANEPAAPRPLDQLHSETAAGEVLGTPGYMSPECALGEAVTEKSDVFSLGAILFEILTLERLIPGDSDTYVRLATLTGSYETRLSVRHPELDIQPDLASACDRATARDPDERLGSARELHDAIERYLEGEGDAHRRRSLSRKHTRAAVAALADANEAHNPAELKAARARAIEQATRALALDAENTIAVSTVAKLLAEAPDTMTPEAIAAARAIEAEANRKTARRAALMYLLVISNLALTVLLGVRSWLVLGVSAALLLCAASLAYWASQKPREGQWWSLPIIAISCCGFALTSGLFGPFVYAPTLVAANVIVAAAGLSRRVRRAAIGLGSAAVLVPVIVQWLGWASPSWIFRDGIIAIVPHVVDLSEIPTTLFLAAMSVGTVVLPAMVVGIERDARAIAERRLALQAHQLAEFLPAEAKGVVDRSSVAPGERR